VRRLQSQLRLLASMVSSFHRELDAALQGQRWAVVAAEPLATKKMHEKYQYHRCFF
jgi:hypothetical protein